MGKTADADVNYMLAWVAVRGLSPGKALEAIDREISDVADAREAPGWPDFLNRQDYHDRIFMGRLPGNWLLLFGSLDEEDKELLVELTELGPAFAGDISRIGSFAEARSYARGEEVWRVNYDLESNDSDNLLQVDGQLPSALAAIVDRARATEAEGREAGIDVLFEVPGQLSKAICGFSPHEEPPEGFRWSMLQRIGGEVGPQPKRQPKGCLALLFGWR